MDLRLKHMTDMGGDGVSPTDLTDFKQHYDYFKKLKQRNPLWLQEVGIAKMVEIAVHVIESEYDTYENPFPRLCPHLHSHKILITLCNHSRVRGSFYNVIDVDLRVKHAAFKQAKHPLYFNIDLEYSDLGTVVKNAVQLWCNSYQLREHKMGEQPFYELNMLMDQLIEGTLEKTFLQKCYWVYINVRICEAYDEYPGFYNSTDSYEKNSHPFTSDEWMTIGRALQGSYYVLLPYSHWVRVTVEQGEGHSLLGACPGVSFNGTDRCNIKNSFTRALSDSWEVYSTKNGKQNRARYVCLITLLYKMIHGSSSISPGYHLKHSDRNRCQSTIGGCCLSVDCYIVEKKTLKRKLLC